MTADEQGPTRLYLVRHGQTAANVRMALDSLPPGPPLNEEGTQQARELAGSLAHDRVDAVYASEALRAQQTAAPLAAQRGLDVRVVGGVQEVFVGDLEGRNDHDSIRRFLEVYTAWAHGDLDRPMPGGETAKQVLRRYTDAVHTITQRHRGGSVVLVSHGAVIRLVAPALAPNINPSLGEHAILPNTGRVVLDAHPDGWRCVEWTGVRLP
ncbi:MAG: histidine phosphatase family protein [Sciscionella sp.]